MTLGKHKFRLLKALAVAAAVSGAGSSTAQDMPFAAFDLASEAVLNDPHDLTIGPDGDLYVADKFGNRIVVMDPETLDVLWTFGDGALSGAHDISFGPDGRAYVSVTGLGRVDIFELGDRTATLVGSLPGLPRTEGVLAHSNGRVYAMASGTGQIIGFEGETAVAAGAGMLGAHDVAEAPDGTIWVADTNARRLVHLDTDLAYLGEIRGPQYGFIGPRYLDVDDFGRLVVADQDAHRILLIDPETDTLLGVLGDSSPGIGPGKFDDPEGVAEFGGRYFFADSDNNRVVRYSVVMN